MVWLILAAAGLGVAVFAWLLWMIGELEKQLDDAVALLGRLNRANREMATEISKLKARFRIGSE